MLEIKNISKSYVTGTFTQKALDNFSLKFRREEFVSILGQSGSGKTTLLNIIGGLDKYDEGDLIINDKSTKSFKEKDWDAYRNNCIGFIFQNYNLITHISILENIEMGMTLSGVGSKEKREKALEALKKVGLEEHAHKKPNQLSGGQMQRVAIARALAKETPILIADEPTGNLDSTSAKEIIKLLHDISKDKLVIIVTHNYDQVEKYVTRKIKMHDGKILEDKVLKDTKKVTYHEEKKQKYLKVFEKFRLGLRNTFNIFPKFILVLMVYLFVVSAVMMEYSFFKKQLFINETSGYNNFFQNTELTRIVIKKENKEAFTEEDYKQIKNIPHIKKIVPYDYLLDNVVYLHDENSFYYQGTINDISTLNKKKITYGTIPTKSDEILILGSPNDYSLNSLGKEIIGKKVSIEMGNSSDMKKTYTITGLIYDEELKYNENGYIYGTQELVNDLKFVMNTSVSQLKVLFQEEYHDSNSYDIHYKIIPNDKVKSGTCLISSDFNMTCKNETCKNYPLKVEVNNLYYQDNLELKVENTYDKKNIKTLLGDYDYDTYNGAIFINQSDYQRVFNKGNYQSSIFVDEVKNLDTVNDTLQKENLKTLKIKDTLVTSGIVEALKIVRAIVTAILFITLFFIAYFVVRIILKSRNTYFGTIRILGTRCKDCKHLLEIELFTTSNIAYFTFILLLILNQNHILNLSILSSVINYLKLSDYILLYLACSLMSYLISLRFSRKIFKNSAMKTMREEV